MGGGGKERLIERKRGGERKEMGHVENITKKILVGHKYEEEKRNNQKWAKINKPWKISPALLAK